MDNLFRIPYEIKINNYNYIFPYSSNINKLRITDIGLYSTIFAISSKKLINKIKFFLYYQNIYLHNMNCLDIGCCIGGFFYYLAKECKYTVGIDNQKIHIDICNNNLNILYKKNNYKILLGDINEIYNNNNINLNNLFYFKNNLFISYTNFKIFNKLDFIYIGTPFIDLKFGDLKLIDLIYKLYDINKPSVFLVQIPCSYDNKIHKNFYDNDIHDLFKTMITYNYKICLINDIKKNNKSYNLHILFVKNFKSWNFPNPPVKLFFHPKLQIILSDLIDKYNIIYLINKYNINFAWKPIYNNSVYINGFIDNNYLKVVSDYDLNKSLKIPLHDTKYINKLNLKFKYNRFISKLYYIM